MGLRASIKKSFEKPVSDLARKQANSMRALSLIGLALIHRPGADGDCSVLGAGSAKMMQAAVRLSSLLAEKITQDASRPDALVAKFNTEVSLPLISECWQRNDGALPSEAQLEILAQTLTQLGREYTDVCQPSDFVPNDQWKVALAISMISALAPVAERIQNFHLHFPKKNPFAEPEQMLASLLEAMHAANKKALADMDIDFLSKKDQVMLTQSLIQASGRFLSGLVSMHCDSSLKSLFEMTPQQRAEWARQYPAGIPTQTIIRDFNRMHNALSAGVSLQVHKMRNQKTPAGPDY